MDYLLRALRADTDQAALELFEQFWYELISVVESPKSSRCSQKHKKYHLDQVGGGDMSVKLYTWHLSKNKSLYVTVQRGFYDFTGGIEIKFLKNQVQFGFRSPKTRRKRNLMVDKKTELIQKIKAYA